MELKAEKTAILFIEYQNEFLSEGGNLNDGVKDFVEESNMIGNSVDLANKAREKGVTIIHAAFVSSTQAGEKIKSTHGTLSEIKAAGFFKEDTWNTDFIDQMKPKPGDIVIEKHRLDTFRHTNLQEILEENGIEVLAVAGLLTQCCVEATIRSAYDRDFEVIGLTDCTATNSKERQRFTVEKIFPTFCKPMTKDQFLACFKN